MHHAREHVLPIRIVLVSLFIAAASLGLFSVFFISGTEYTAWYFDSFHHRQIAYSTFEVWTYVRERLKNGSNFSAVHGKIMALSSNVLRRVIISQEVIGDDAYLCLMCMKLGYKAAYTNKGRRVL